MVSSLKVMIVATVLTACGIETDVIPDDHLTLYSLQQYLPLAVLKLNSNKNTFLPAKSPLQQYLPLAVLKPNLGLCGTLTVRLQQYLPLAVLKPAIFEW